MAQDRQFVQQWRDANALSRYPFADGASLLSKSGMRLPAGVFVDAVIYVPSAQNRLYLSAIEVKDTQVSVVIGDEQFKDTATGVISFPDVADLIPLYDHINRPAGTLVVDTGNVLELAGWPDGVHRFEPAAGEIVASCLVPVPNYGVTAFLLEDGTVLSGDVWLVGEDGIVLSEPDYNVCRVDIVGEPLWRRKECEPSNLFTNPSFIKTINGIAPNAAGQFILTEGENIATKPVIRFRPSGHSLVLEVLGRGATGGAL